VSGSLQTKSERNSDSGVEFIETIEYE